MAVADSRPRRRRACHGRPARPCFDIAGRAPEEEPTCQIVGRQLPAGTLAALDAGASVPSRTVAATRETPAMIDRPVRGEVDVGTSSA